MNKGNRFCDSRNFPVEKLDELVICALEGRVLTTAKLQKILTEARVQLRERSATDRHKLSHLQAELRKTEGRQAKLYEAIETGILPLDETLRQRMQRVKSERESLLIEMAGLRRLQTLPFERILPSQVEAFGKVMRRRLRDRSSTFARDYLRAVVDRVVVRGNAAVISGSHAKLMRAVATGKLDADQVPSFVPDWRARRDSNSRPPGS